MRFGVVAKLKDHRDAPILLYAKIMQNQMVKSGTVISGGYLLIGIVIKGYCGINATKTGESISHLKEFYSIGDNLPLSNLILNKLIK